MSDTSPITALMALGQLAILSDLFGDVIIPPAVQRELLRAHTALPAWIRTIPLVHTETAKSFLADLDAGESEAIALALETHADALLIDERKGRRIATDAGIRVVGLLGIAAAAKQRGLLPSVADFIDRLKREVSRPDFRLSPWAG